jgi:glycosyltransferase involved in cell wall biosynthesis
MSQNKKVALFIPSLEGGGAERVMVNLGHTMLEFGLSVDLLAASIKGPYVKQIDPRIRLINFDTKRTLTSFPQLVKYLRENRPQAIISALAHCNVLAIWAKKLAGVNTKVVVSDHIAFSLLEHSSNAVQRTHRNLLLMMRASYPFADSIVAVSQGVADDLHALAGVKRKIDVIFNPVLSQELFRKADLPVDHPWLHTDIPVVLAVGRLEHQKDFPNLLQAFALLKKLRPARLMILGEGSERNSLEDMVKALGLEQDVWMPGFVDNPYAYMKHADVFAMSSLFEGLPTVLIEAMAVGTPVVSTDCKSGPREIFTAAQYGTLVPIQNPQSLADALHQTLSQARTSVDASKMQPYMVEVATKAYMRVAGFDVTTLQMENTKT